MLRIIDRLTNVLLLSSSAEVQSEWVLILDKNRCPLSGKPMINPVTDMEGINYDLQNINNWLSTHNYSPISGARLLKGNLLVNRSLKNVLEEALEELNKSHKEAELIILNNPTLPDILLNRYVVTLHWSCKIPQDIDPKVYSRIHERTQNIKDPDWWPLSNDTYTVSEMTWFAFSALRNYVYQEFQYVLRANNIDNFIRSNARDYFIRAMESSYMKSKPEQIEIAIANFCERYGRQNTPRMQLERSQLWCTYFNVKPPEVVMPSMPLYPAAVPHTPYGDQSFMGLSHGHNQHRS